MASAEQVSPSTRQPSINVGYVTMVAGAAAIGGFLFGFDSAVINGAVPGIQATFGSSASSCLMARPPAEMRA